MRAVASDRRAKELRLAMWVFPELWTVFFVFVGGGALPSAFSMRDMLASCSLPWFLDWDCGDVDRWRMAGGPKRATRVVVLYENLLSSCSPYGKRAGLRQ